MSGATGNPDALKNHKEDSLQKTRRNLELALARLRNGNPKKVKRGTPVNASSVAEEAGVDRSTLYRYHQPILREIQRINETTPKQRLKAKHGELSEAVAKQREYREMLEAAQTELAHWAQQNYILSHRIQELEATAQRQEEVIKNLRTQIKKAGVVVSMEPRQKR